VNVNVVLGRAPPSLVEGPPAGVEYFASEAEGEKVELRCRATGIPTPESVAAYKFLLQYFISLHIAAQAPLILISGFMALYKYAFNFYFKLAKILRQCKPYQIGVQ